MRPIKRFSATTCVRRIVVATTSIVASSSFAAAPITIGETTIPLGEAAFATQVQCVNQDGCGADISPLTPPPELRFFGSLDTLKADHILDGVFADLNEDEDLQLDFTTPILNQTGTDLYLAQAFFLGNRLGFGAADVNGFSLRFDADPTMHSVPASAFVQDSALPVQTFYFAEPAVESEAYRLYYAAVDLSDFGFGNGASVSKVFIRGAEVGSQEDEKLDIVAVASLNITEPPTGTPTLRAQITPILNILILESE